MSNRHVRIGGLLRCCIETIRVYEGPEERGTIVTCLHCHQPTIIMAYDGVWEWVKYADYE